MDDIAQKIDQDNHRRKATAEATKRKADMERLAALEMRDASLKGTVKREQLQDLGTLESATIREKQAQRTEKRFIFQNTFPLRLCLQCEISRKADPADPAHDEPVQKKHHNPIADVGEKLQQYIANQKTMISMATQRDDIRREILHNGFQQLPESQDRANDLLSHILEELRMQRDIQNRILTIIETLSDMVSTYGYSIQVSYHH